MTPPTIPINWDYISVHVRLRSGVILFAHYCRRWGWRDDKFNELLDVIEWWVK